MLDVNMFDQLKIGLATAEHIRDWSHGEVKKPETINYRTLRPEKDGLFCEKIFGPTRDWECYCGKYKRVRFKGIICERCGVEVTRSKVRRERMGHIELSAPVVHIWYLRGTRSWLAYLLAGIEPKEELKAKQLEKVIYFAANLVTFVDEDKRHTDLSTLEAEFLAERDEVRKELELAIDRRYKEAEDEAARSESEGADARKAKNAVEKDVQSIRDRYEMELDLLQRTWDEFRKLHGRLIIDDEILWRELKDRYGDYFEGGTGADAIKDLIDRIDFDDEERKLREAIDTTSSGRKPLSAQRKQKAIKRLKIVASFNKRDDSGRRLNDPKAMILDVVPVIPPELRPMVQLDGGRFATSDLNDLYRRVINRNNRLKRLLDLGAPEIIVNNEKRMLQEAVDALFDNGRRGRPVTGPGNRPLKSLSDMLKGKQGRFRQNLLGKRVDYSGRSVIVAGPTLKLHQCGLPKLMALELFKPFVMKRLVDQELAQNIKSAKRMVERRRPQVWDVLEDVIKEHPVLLNRAPTLHRLGIQAFEPVLVEGKALQIHPLVCTAFNADFDGDQMAIHVPLSAEAQAEARVLMLSANNILSPASGRPIVTPSQDLIIGGYYLSEMLDEAKGAGRVFRHTWEVLRAVDEGSLDLHAPIMMRRKEIVSGAESTEFRTTPGRLLFEEALPLDYPARFGHVDHLIKKKEMGVIVERLSDNYKKSEIAGALDAIKNVCYRYAAQSGLTVSIDDVKTPKSKRDILDKHEEQADKVEKQFKRGIITDGERRQQEVRIWTDATAEVQRAMEAEFKAQKFNPIDMMVGSGARGNMTQMRQIAGMRGLVANPRGDMIPRPIKRNFREGLETLEYFIATPGARKGLVDTALRTADSGYLTRRLVDVAQELIIREVDCGTKLGVWVENVGVDTANRRAYLETKLFGRALLTDTTLSDGTVLPRNTIVGDPEMAALRDDPKVDRLRVRSVLTCDAELGVCGLCYGRSLATGKQIELGEAVGVIAAQSIGEPGTQLTMRTFHTGGVAGKDIAGGLPRVVELFESRTPKGSARLARATGVIRILEDEGKGIPIVVVDDQGEEHTIVLPTGSRPIVTDGQDVKAGDPITDGPFDPKELMEIKGIRETQLYLVEEVQKVYRDQGVSIHDKHIELIVRQMTRRIGVQEPGDTGFLPGERADAKVFRDTNKRMVEEGNKPAEGRPEIMGITKASLATESWLSAASFQETTRVLTEAAIDGRGDSLLGLKENIIIGKLIPAGTGMMRYREFNVDAPEYRPMDGYSSDYDEDPAAWLSNIHGTYSSDGDAVEG
jgi:DNA-directed RNA polymerase subunit beta'